MTQPSAGELNRRIVIRKFHDVPNVSFGTSQTVDTGITRWAKMQAVSGGLYWGTKQVGDEITHRFWVRYGSGTRPEDITGEFVIELLGQRYRVKRATDWEAEQVHTMIETTLLGAI